MAEIPYLSTDQMIEVDRAMVDDFCIALIQMMENAGRNLAHLARTRFLGGDPRGRRVVVLCGTGGNGGGGLVCARRLHNWGASVTVVTTRLFEAYRGVPAHQLEIVRRLQMVAASESVPSQFEAADLVIDAMIGYSLRGAPAGPTAELIRWTQGQSAPVLSLDVPSGIDAATGMVYDPAVRATATMTLALPKTGLDSPSVRDGIGELYLADISVPPELYERPPLNLQIGPLFATEDVIRLA